MQCHTVSQSTNDIVWQFTTTPDSFTFLTFFKTVSASAPPPSTSGRRVSGTLSPGEYVQKVGIYLLRVMEVSETAVGTFCSPLEVPWGNWGALTRYFSLQQRCHLAFRVCRIRGNFFLFSCLSDWKYLLSSLLSQRAGIDFIILLLSRFLQMF